MSDLIGCVVKFSQRNGGSSQGLVKDSISRQDAIATSLEFFVEYLGGAFNENGQKELMARLQRLPSAEPQHKKGKWIDCSEDGFVECPFCHSATNCDGNKDELHYCFSCGADMRGEQE